MVRGTFTSDRPLLISLLIAAIAVLTVIWQILDAVVLAASLAVVIFPLYRIISARSRPGAGAALTCLLVLVAVILFLAFAVSVFLDNRSYIEELIGTVFTWVESAQSASVLSQLSIEQDQAVLFLKSTRDVFSRYVTSLAGQLLFIGFKVVLFFTLLFLFLYKGEVLIQGISRGVPPHATTTWEELKKTGVDTLYAIYVVQGIIVVITFVLALPFFLVLGYGHVLFLATASGIMKLNPVIGPSVIMLVLGIQALSIGDTRGLLLLIFIGYPVVCALPDLLLRPILMGRRTAIHPAIMWVGYFGGILTMGFIGFILGPLILALVARGYPTLIREIRRGSAGEGESSTGAKDDEDRSEPYCADEPSGPP
ncbi:MAG: AI-2E family transporter [Methanomicrobiales archaeon]|nr:AI-2E family transporter [Methanomicrobiales archaeon]